MPEPTLADLFADARTLLDGKGGHVIKVTKVGTDCIRPFWEWRLDPAYDALRKVMADQEVPDPDNSNGVFLVSAAAYWEQAPDGALEGALKKALLHISDTAIYTSAVPLIRGLTRLSDQSGDTRTPAMQAVVEWLREVHHESTD